ncbi:hypothetical protein PMPD1_2717 [Paramixta manurensis]|uniref:Uncharacterized protein n=1 Tax=Paramixta manurensis TaxID=2740817 RepID=A0A6M8UA64_9GAMM|nr:hypothetical protein PMPD1_2717 [Erwiniaceae bacterium PD-1]
MSKRSRSTMRKIIFRGASLLILLLIIFELSTCALQSKAGEGEGYTQADFFLYHMVTDSEIKQTPRITQSYYFTFSTRDGSAPMQSSIIFRGTQETSTLKTFLVEHGYHYMGNDSGSERWIKNASFPSTFYLWVNSDHQQVGLSKATW